jgi:hypothetical protein
MGLGKSLQALALLWVVLSNNLVAKAESAVVRVKPCLENRKKRKEGHKYTYLESQNPFFLVKRP